MQIEKKRERKMHTFQLVRLKKHTLKGKKMVFHYLEPLCIA